ncbi:MAG TPA: porin family protein [Bacteroidia bacterium]
MKLTTKFSLLLASVLLLSQNAYSQDDRDFRIGFKIIPGFDWVKTRTNDVKKDGSSIGFSFGLMSDIKLADNYFFSPEINITSMTNKVKMKDTTAYTLPGSGMYNAVNYKYSLKYFEIPLTFKFRTNENNGMRYWGQFGIAPGFIIGSNVSTLANPTKGNTKNFPTDEKYIPNDKDNDVYDFSEHSDNINVLRCSMILGAGIEYNLSGNTSFYTGIRFNNGFTDFLGDNKSKAINNVLGLELGIFF